MYIDGFTVRTLKDRLKPLEDSFNYCGNEEEAYMVVADGITRDPKGMQTLPSQNIKGIENALELIKAVWNYPRLSKKFKRVSPAKFASDSFCEAFIEHSVSYHKHGAEAVARAMKESNKLIRKINSLYNPNPGYGENDFWACVAASAIVSGDLLSWGYIADCGIKVFDEAGRLIMKTQNEGPNSKGSIDEDIKRKYGEEFRNLEGRVRVRKEYRNNPQNPLSYGAFTGEPLALQYVRTGEKYIPSKSIVVLHTDGLEKAAQSTEFAEALRRKNFGTLKAVCKNYVENEGSLVLCDKDY